MDHRSSHIPDILSRVREIEKLDKVVEGEDVSSAKMRKREEILKEIKGLLDREKDIVPSQYPLSLTERSSLEKLLGTTYFEVERLSHEKESLKKEVGLQMERDTILRHLPGSWKEERGLIEKLDHTNISSLLMLMNLERGERESILSEFGGECKDASTGRRKYLANRKVIGMLREAGYRPDGSLGAYEASIVGEYLAMTLDDDSRLRKFLLPYMESAQVGLSPTSLDRYRDREKDDITLYEGLTDLPFSDGIRRELSELLMKLEKDPEKMRIFWSRLGYDGIQSRGDLFIVSVGHSDIRNKLYEYISIGLHAGYSIADIIDSVYTSGKRIGSVKVLDTVLRNTLDTLSEKGLESLGEFEKTAVVGIGEQSMMRNFPKVSGQLQILTESLYANIVTTNPSIGLSLTYETFLKNITLLPGIGVAGDGKWFGGLSMKYSPELQKKITESGTSYSGVSTGIGAGLTSGFLPFVEIMNGEMPRTQNLTSGGIEMIDMSDRMTMIMPTGGMIIFSEHTDTIMSINGHEEVLLRMMVILASEGLSDDILSPSSLMKVAHASGIKSIHPRFIASLISDLKSVQRYFDLSEQTDILTRFHILRGYVLHEVSLIGDELVRNDRDTRSLSGGGIGIGYHAGTVGPVGNIILTRHMKDPGSHMVRYRYSDTGIAASHYLTPGTLNRKNSLIGFGSFREHRGAEDGGDEMMGDVSTMSPKKMGGFTESSLLSPSREMSRSVPFAVEDVIETEGE